MMSKETKVTPFRPVRIQLMTSVRQLVLVILAEEYLEGRLSESDRDSLQIGHGNGDCPFVEFRNEKGGGQAC